MKKTSNKIEILCLAAGVALAAINSPGETILVKPSRGGGIDTNAPMIHVDVFYDYDANEMRATLDTTKGVPKLVPLPAGYAFDSRSNYAVLTGKAYSLQYAWNPGGVFSPPAGAAVWIECLSRSPELETYDGPGNKMITPPRPYTPIFGTAGSSSKWQWYGQMAHNAYAVLHPTNSTLTAEYRLYFGDAATGARDGYQQYDDATVTLTWTVDPVIVVKTSRGGGLDTNSPMVHVDIFYDYTNNQMKATLDTSKGIPVLKPLPAGYMFDSRSNYAVLNGKAYNYQYAWNPGGVFSPPAGGAVWIECTSRAPELETYDGPGNKMVNPPRTYGPIFGTEGSSTKWKWYGQMAHNSYAVLNPTNSSVTADYRIYFADAQTGSEEGYSQYGQATMRLTWKLDLPMAPVLQFGAMEQNSGTPLGCLNAETVTTNSRAVVNFQYASSGPSAQHYDCCLPLLAVPATAANGGPATNHAAVGARLELEFVSLTGPADGGLCFWETGEAQQRFMVPVDERAGTNRVVISQNAGAPEADPYGQIAGRHYGLTQPGIYCLGFRVVDTSTNGPGGGPVHAPSPVYHMYLQGGLTISGLTMQGNAATAIFGGEAARSFYLESRSSLDPASSWRTVAGPLTGTARLQSLTDPAADGPQRFFRLRTTTP